MSDKSTSKSGVCETTIVIHTCLLLIYIAEIQMIEELTSKKLPDVGQIIKPGITFVPQINYP